MKKVSFVLLLVAVVLSLTMGTVLAQTTTGERKGTIQGLVYEDVDGDGKCVNTGVEGENPVEGVDIEFVSSDEQTVFTLYSGPDGIYGAFAMGFSYWKLTAKPSSDWVVTSENPVYIPIFEDSLVATGVNFCVQKAGARGAAVVLPQSGGAYQGWWTAVIAFAALTLIGTGAALEVKRRFS